MAAPPRFCLACGKATQPNARRLLCSEASSNVCQVWSELLAERLKERHAEVDVHSLMEDGYVCKKCFMSVKAFYDRKIQLLRNLDAAIESMPSSAITFVSDLATRQSRKRASDFIPERPAKRRRLNITSSSSASPGVKIIVGYESKPRVISLTPSRKRLGKKLARGSSVSVALECVRDRKTQKHVVSAVGRLLWNEIKSLCSRHVKSMQRLHDASTLKGFNWDAIVAEAIEHAPNLVQILKECTRKRPKQSEAQQKNIVGICLSLLCKYRNPKMTLFQRIVSLVLYGGHSAKQVFNRLQKLGVCASHRDTLNSLDILGEGYETKVKQWRADLMPKIVQNKNTSEVCMEQISGEAVTSLFREQEEDVEEEECVCDLLGGSLDCSLEWGDDHITSTPKKMDASNLESAASSPVSFLRPNYSALSMEDSDNDPDVDGILCSTGYSSPIVPNMPQQSFIQTAVADPVTYADPSMSKDNARGVKLVGDNVDKTVKTRYTRIDQQGRSLHYFHAYATQDRFDLSMPEEAPCVPSNPDLSKLLPSSDDKSNITQLFAIHIARVLCKHMPFFSEDFGDAIPVHIEHPMSSNMSKKSEVAPLGVYLKDENKLEEIVDILDELQKYAPSTSQTKDVPIPNSSEVRSLKEITFHRLLFGGDQLTAKRARAGIRIRNNSTNSADRLEGLLPVAEDWHAKVVFLEVIWKRLYKSTSASDVGTIFQLRNLINRKNIGNKPSRDVNAFEDFFHLVVESHILAAAMEFLGMESIDDKPAADIFPPCVWMLSQDERRKILTSVCEAIVDEFVDISTIDLTDTNAVNQQVQVEQVDEDEVSCDTHNIHGRQKNDKQEDKVLAYAKELLSFGLLYKELVDAVREGDGARVLRWWRFMLLIYKATGHKNYCIEAFIMLAQYQYLLSEREQQQLLYSRFINTHGQPGKNISCDLYMEHLNRLLKGAIQALGANKTPKAITRVGKCIASLEEIFDNFDILHKVPSQTTDHKIPTADRDMTCILNELCSAQVFRNICGRKHGSFSRFQNNPILSLDKGDTQTWMTTQWAKLLAGLL